jgi:hypothetical protein
VFILTILFKTILLFTHTAGMQQLKKIWFTKWIKILVLKFVDMLKFALNVQNSARLVRVDHNLQSVNNLHLSQESLYVHRSLFTLQQVVHILTAGLDKH